jgi:hypothetical protein
MAKARRVAVQNDQDDAAEQAMLAGAIADTESEIFLEAMGDGPAENDGDRSLEEMGDELGDVTDPEDGAEGDQFVDPNEMAEVDPVTGEPVEGEEEPDGGDAEFERDNAPGDPADGATIPARTDTSMLPSWRRGGQQQGVDPEVAALRERLARLEGQQQAPRGERQEQRTEDEVPDQLLHPQEWQAYQDRRTEERIALAVRTSRLEDNFRTMEQAYDREGRVEEFRFASQNLERLSNSARSGNRGDQAIVQSIINARDPAHALMQWAEDNLDLANYRASVEGNAIEQAARLLGVDPEELEGLRQSHDGQQERQGPSRQQGRGREQQAQERGQQSRQAPSGGRRLPSLNGAGSAGGRGGNSRTNDARGFDGSEGAIFDYALNG